MCDAGWAKHIGYYSRLLRHHKMAAPQNGSRLTCTQASTVAALSIAGAFFSLLMAFFTERKWGGEERTLYNIPYTYQNRPAPPGGHTWTCRRILLMPLSTLRRTRRSGSK